MKWKELKEKNVEIQESLLKLQKIDVLEKDLNSQKGLLKSNAKEIDDLNASI